MRTLKTVVLTALGGLIGSLVVFQLSGWNWLSLTCGCLVGSLLGFLSAGTKKPNGSYLSAVLDQLETFVGFVIDMTIIVSMLAVALVLGAILLAPNMWLMDMFYPMAAGNTNISTILILNFIPFAASWLAMRLAYTLRGNVRPSAEILQEESLEKGLWGFIFFSVFGTLFAVGYLIHVLIFQGGTRRLIQNLKDS